MELTSINWYSYKLWEKVCLQEGQWTLAIFSVFLKLVLRGFLNYFCSATTEGVGWILYRCKNSFDLQFYETKKPRSRQSSPGEDSYNRGNKRPCFLVYRPTPIKIIHIHESSVLMYWASPLGLDLQHSCNCGSLQHWYLKNVYTSTKGSSASSQSIRSRGRSFVPF